jgi:hypothetical protein
MAGLAGLDSVVISGYAGFGVTRKNMEANRHAWNAVKINGQWEFVDPTWAMQEDVKAFEDVNSNLYSWKTGVSKNWEIGDEIKCKAGIKSHELIRGLRVTNLTRLTEERK